MMGAAMVMGRGLSRIARVALGIAAGIGAGAALGAAVGAGGARGRDDSE